MTLFQQAHCPSLSLHPSPRGLDLQLGINELFVAQSKQGGECQTDAWGISAFDALSKKGRFIFYSHMASSEFRAEAVQGTEQYARRHAYSRISRQVVEEYKKTRFLN